MPRDPKLIAAEAALKAVQDKARRAKMGPPLKLSDAALTQAATVGDADVAVAEAVWDRDCSPDFRGLLDGQVREG